VRTLSAALIPPIPLPLLARRSWIYLLTVSVASGNATGIAFVVYQLSARMIGISLLGASLPKSLLRLPVRALMGPCSRLNHAPSGQLEETSSISLRVIPLLPPFSC